MDFFQIVMFVFGIIFVVIQLLILNYLFRLEKTGCECAMDWRRSYTMFFLVLTLLYTVSALFIDRSTIPILQTVMVVLGLVNVVVVLQYVHKLKEEKCACSESIYREIMMYGAIFNAIVYSALLSILIFFLFTVASFARGAEGRVGTVRKGMSIRPIKKIVKGIRKP